MKSLITSLAAIGLIAGAVAVAHAEETKPTPAKTASTKQEPTKPAKVAKAKKHTKSVVK